MKHTGLYFVVICLLILLSYLLWGDTEQGMEQQLSALAAQREHYVFFSFVLLASDILLPVPNSIIMYTNGFLLGIVPGACLSVVSLMAGAAVGYGLGRFTAMGKRIEKDGQAPSFWARYGDLAIIVTRGIPVVSESVCMLGGYVGIPLRRYLLLNLLGYIPVALLFAVFGSWGLNEGVFLISVAASLLMALGFWLLGRRGV